MTAHDDCVPREALLRLAEEMECRAASSGDLADEPGASLYSAAIHAGRSAAWHQAGSRLRAVAGLPPRAPLTDLASEEIKP